MIFGFGKPQGTKKRNVNPPKSGKSPEPILADKVLELESSLAQVKAQMQRQDEAFQPDSVKRRAEFVPSRRHSKLARGNEDSSVGCDSMEENVSMAEYTEMRRRIIALAVDWSATETRLKKELDWYSAKVKRLDMDCERHAREKGQLSEVNSSLEIQCKRLESELLRMRQERNAQIMQQRAHLDAQRASHRQKEEESAGHVARNKIVEATHYREFMEELKRVRQESIDLASQEKAHYERELQVTRTETREVMNELSLVKNRLNKECDELKIKCSVLQGKLLQEHRLRIGESEANPSKLGPSSVDKTR